MPSPFEGLKWVKYAKEEIEAIINKYPHIVTYSGGGPSNDPFGAIGVTGEMMHNEFEPIFKKILDGVKMDMQGSDDAKPFVGEWGTYYPSKIDYDYYKNSMPSDHGGYPGVYSMFEMSPTGQLGLKIRSLGELCGWANSYIARAKALALEKEACEAAEKMAAEHQLKVMLLKDEEIKLAIKARADEQKKRYDLLVQKTAEKRINQQRFEKDVEREIQKRLTKNEKNNVIKLVLNEIV